MEEKLLLGIGYQSGDTECSVLCNGTGFSRLPMGLLVLSSLKRAGAKLQRQTLLSSGHTVYKHKDGAFKSFGTHKIQSSKKKQMKK